MVLQYKNIRSITADYGDLTVGVLREFLDGLPNDTVVSVSHYAGDQREPSQTTLTAENPRKRTPPLPTTPSGIAQQRDGSDYVGPYGVGVPFGE